MLSTSPFELAFSATTRADHWSTLGERTFDLLVIGGGITGAGIAHDAAGRGLDVALVEAGDFAVGTSSRSSRLIHGGLRYLETLDFGLVFEALGERARLLELAPHLVHPLPFLYPVYRGGGVGMNRLRAGMWLYDGLSLFRGLPRHRMLGRDAVLRREPGLWQQGLRGGAVYFDAQVDDARLTLAVARAAHQAGAVMVPQARVTGFVLGEAGTMRGARVRDQIGGGEVDVRARLVLSAAGPWTDEVRRLADPAARPRLRPTKGVHIQTPRARVGNRGAVIFRSSLDGRVMFVLPWGAYTYVGTTDTDLDGDPTGARAEEVDVDYLLRSVNGIYPGARLVREDALSSWTGVRPLLSPDAEEVGASQTSREHSLWRERSGLLCIAGGKLTTFRTMAAEAAREAARILEREHGVRSGEYYTHHVPLPGAPPEGWDAFLVEIQAEAAAMGLDAESAEHLARAYGTDASDLLARMGDQPQLAGRIDPAHPYLWAEVGHAVRHEMALRLEDVLRRRLHLFYDARDGGLSSARAVAQRMAEEPGLSWSAGQVEDELERYRAAVLRTRGFGEAAVRQDASTPRR